jgi:hypothetical protein
MSILVSSNECSSRRLCQGAEDCLAVLDLTRTDQEIVRNCISRYSLPSTFCELLGWLAFRVTNTFKALYGASEWQKAKEVIQNHMFGVAAQEGLSFQQNPQSKLEKKIKSAASQVIDDYATRVLDLCLLAEDSKSTSSENLKQQLQEVNLRLVVHQMTEITRRLRNPSSGSVT